MTTSTTRITPACAGNRSEGDHTMEEKRDHPRVCGEQPWRGGGRLLGWGSPPRVRGTGAFYRDGRRKQRITPACAGNSMRGRDAPQAVKDHPRVCGEQLVPANISSHFVGSPPRVRGTVASAGNQSSNLRITPACAGNRIQFAHRNDHTKDHPRVCGEQTTRPWTMRATKGSPPRVRGTDEAEEVHTSKEGITPACAGNRYLTKPRYLLSWDHPRVCGEQVENAWLDMPAAGSPPRVRGTAMVVLALACPRRITPACAGNRLLLRLHRRLDLDHPRVCGEQTPRDTL